MKYTFSNGKTIEYSPKIYRVVTALKEHTKFPNYSGKLVISSEDSNLRLTQTDMDNILNKLASLPTGIQEFSVCHDMPYSYHQGILISGCGCDRRIESETSRSQQITCNQFVIGYDEQKLLEFANEYINMGRERRRQLSQDYSTDAVFFPPGHKVIYQNKVLYFKLNDGSAISASFANSPELRPVFETFWELRKNTDATVFATPDFSEAYKRLFTKNYDRQLSDDIANIRQLVHKKNAIPQERFTIKYFSPGKWTFWVK